MNILEYTTDYDNVKESVVKNLEEAFGVEIPIENFDVWNANYGVAFEFEADFTELANTYYMEQLKHILTISNCDIDYSTAKNINSNIYLFARINCVADNYSISDVKFDFDPDIEICPDNIFSGAILAQTAEDVIMQYITDTLYSTDLLA